MDSLTLRKTFGLSFSLFFVAAIFFEWFRQMLGLPVSFLASAVSSLLHPMGFGPSFETPFFLSLFSWLAVVAVGVLAVVYLKFLPDTGRLITALTSINLLGLVWTFFSGNLCSAQLCFSTTLISAAVSSIITFGTLLMWVFLRRPVR